MTSDPISTLAHPTSRGEAGAVEEFPTSARSQAQAAAWFVRSHPRVVRLTPGQRDRIVREVRAEQALRDEPRPAGIERRRLRPSA